jgi:stress-induced morphogen
LGLAAGERWRNGAGGCGAMFAIYVESERFRGKTLVQQHRMVNEALKEELASMHGITVQTAVPS